MRKLLLWCTAVFWILVGCTLIDAISGVGQAPQPTPAGSTQPQIEAIPTATPTDIPLPEPTRPAASPAPTIPPTEVPACVPPQDPGPLEASRPEAFSIAVLDFLNAGGTPADLDAALYEAGVANTPTTVVEADFNGDSRPDLAVSIFDPASITVPPEGRLMVYLCQEGRFALVLDQRTAEFAGGPHLWYWEDLNGDGGADLVLSETVCGASSCFENLKVLVWQEGGLVDRFEGASDDLPFPDITILGPDENGAYSLQATAAGFGSVGAGPQRPLTRVWAYEPRAGHWVFSEEYPGVSNFRIHILHDADESLAKGDFDIALLLYQRIIEDDTLDDWVDPEFERGALSAYAYYKTLTIHTLRGELDLADQALEEMSTAFPRSSPHREYVEMAILFQTAFASGGLESACNAAAGFADAHVAAVLEPLGWVYFGYANPEYTSAAMCPVQTGE
jgi:hypothetical protein